MTASVRTWTLGRTAAMLLAFTGGSMLRAAPAHAQLVTGVVRDAGTAQPLAGALVATLDSAGRVVARALSDGRGRFTLARAAGTAAVRVMRIGYTPARHPLAAGSADSIVIALERIPAMLDAMHVSSVASCAGSGSAAALALWEQARAGLEAMVLARESQPARALSITFTRIVNAADSDVIEQTTRRHEGTATRPFRARADPSEFARAGYVEPSGNGTRIYSAPDADVLLDPAFASGHCFSTLRDRRGAAERVGLAFRPSNAHPSVVDVEGTLWFTVDPLTLDELEFSYVDPTGRADSLGAGGKLVFRPIRNGVTFIRSWSIRTPATAVAVAAQSHDLDGARVRRLGGSNDSAPRELRVTRWRESGGRVLSANWSDGASDADPLGSIVGVVVRRETEEAAQRVPVVLSATHDTVSTDSAGVFAFQELLPGRYAVVAQDTAVAAYTGEKPATVSARVRDGARTSVIAQVSDSASALVRLCPALKDAMPRSIILGQIVASQIDPDWEVGAHWQDDYRSLRSSVGIVGAARSTHPDTAGRYYVCGVVRERPIHLGVWLGKNQLLDTAVVVGDGMVKRVDLVMPRAPNRS